LRGRDIKRYGYTFADQYLIALFPSRNYDINEYPAVRDYLLSAEWSDEVPHGHGRERLEQTGRKHTIDGVTFTARKLTGNKWYETQDQIGYWDDFSKQKIVWAELARTGNAFAFASDNVVVLNTAYILVAPELDSAGLKNILLFLNSKTLLYYLNQITTRFDSTGWRWLKQFVELLPVPKVSADDIDELLSVRQSESSRDAEVYRIFGFTNEEIHYIENSLKAQFLRQ
jgi:hypothetical protein